MQITFFDTKPALQSHTLYPTTDTPANTWRLNDNHFTVWWLVPLLESHAAKRFYKKFTGRRRYCNHSICVFLHYLGGDPLASFRATTAAACRSLPTKQLKEEQIYDRLKWRRSSLLFTVIQHVTTTLCHYSTFRENWAQGKK